MTQRLRFPEVVMYQEGPGVRDWEFTEAGVPLMNIRLMKPDYTVQTHDARFVSPEVAFGKWRHFLLEADDIVLASSGSLGKRARISAMNLPLMLNTSVIRFRPLDPKKLSHSYLWHFLGSRDFEKQFLRLKTGTAQFNFGPSHLEQMSIPLPPLEEQKRIAAILDKADAIRRKREQAVKLADEFLRSLFLDMFGDPVRNQKGWPKEPLIQLLDRIESGWSPLCESRVAAADEWAVLKLGAVTKCVFDPRENKAVLQGCVPRPDIEVKDGDVLFSRKNTYELVAACALVVNPPPRLMMSDLIFRLRIRDRRRLLPEYLWQVLIQPSLRGQIQALAGGSAGSMPNISKERLMSAVIPVPSANLQLQFAARLARLSTLNTHCADVCVQAENLRLALTDRAFQGDL